MDFLHTLGFIAIAAFILGIVVAIATSIKRKEVGKSIDAIPGFTTSFRYLGDDGDNGIAIDEQHAKVCLIRRVNGKLIHRVLGYGDILSSELFEDGETITKTVRSSQVGGALVGGLLLGGVGAVIGGLSGKKVGKAKVKRIELRLVVNNSTNPTHAICFLANETKRDGFVYKTASDQARQWAARMDVLIKRAEQETSACQIGPRTAISVSDELRKLAQLKSEGILSEEEFAAQKAKLLG